MHFVTGGAYNGKGKWVNIHYNKYSSKESRVISAYTGEQCPNDLSQFKEPLLILEGIEQWLYELNLGSNTDQSRRDWTDLLLSWMDWEEEDEHRCLVIIGTDISKGIVPMEEETRSWRDLTGWCYQDTTEKASRVDLIWYGINQRIK